MISPEDYTRKRSEILHGAPFMRLFLDADQMAFDPLSWSRRVIQEREKINKQIREEFGPHWDFLATMPLLMADSKTKVFNPSVPDETKITLLRTALVGGYELGDVENAGILLTPTALALTRLELFNPTKLRTRKGQDTAVELTWAVLSTGVIFKITAEHGPVNPYINPEESYNDLISEVDRGIL